MSRVIAATLALHQALQHLRGREVRERFDDEERLVLHDDLVRRHSEGGPTAVLRQWPSLLRDGLADVVSTRRVSRRDTLTRRMADLSLAALVALPILVVVGVLGAAVYVTMGAPIFVDVAYRGRQGRLMKLTKLRTMTTTRPARVTRLGRVLRMTRLDELPTVVALAKGDVTLVGPRAQAPTSGAMVSSVRPGLLGRHLGN